MKRSRLENTEVIAEEDYSESPRSPQGPQRLVRGGRTLFRAVLGVALATATLSASDIPFGEREAMAQASTPAPTPAPKKPLYYNHAIKLNKELNGGTSGPIFGILRIDNPKLYYEHDVKKGLNKKFLFVPTPSMAFGLARDCWLNARSQVSQANDRTISLLKLDQAAQPGVPNQKYLAWVHHMNTLVNNKMLSRWPGIAAEALAIAKKVQQLVTDEAKAAKAMKTPSAAQGLVFPVSLIKLKTKDPKLAAKHSKEFKDYAKIEAQLRPAPYDCDKVSPDENTPSSINELESAKALLVLAELHLAAAVQRKHRYSALQAWMLRNPKQAGAVKKYDGSKHNDKILAGWLELARQKQANGKNGGAILTLIDNLVAVIRLQSKDAESLHRCRN